MRLSLILVVLTLAPFCFTPAQHLGVKITPDDLRQSDSFGTSLKNDGNFLIVGKPGDDQLAANAGAAYIFEYVDSSWVQRAKLTASDGSTQDIFGTSVFISGNYAIAGARGKNDSTGAAYIFERQGDQWIQTAKLTADDGSRNDEFGNSVRIGKNYAVVGAYLDDDKGDASGSAYVFWYDGSTWRQLTKLVPDDGNAKNYFGCSVSISDEYIAVGSYGDDSNGPNSGSVYVYHRSGNTISFDSKLVVPGPSIESRLGYSVAISDNYIISGAYTENGAAPKSGTAYIFERMDNSWRFAQKLEPRDGGENDNFGTRVGISGNIAVVGAPNFDKRKGKAYIFERKDGSWEEALSIIPDDADSGNAAGSAVSVYGTNVVIGVPKNLNSGAVYVYDVSAVTGIVNDKSAALPDSYILSQNYPNPFNPTTSIIFSIPVAGFVSLKVFDVLGNEVATLVNGENPAGVHELNWNASNLPSGIYFCTIRSGNFSAVKKMLLLK